MYPVHSKWPVTASTGTGLRGVVGAATRLGVCSGRCSGAVVLEALRVLPDLGGWE